MWLLFRSFERKTTNIVELKNTPESFEKYIKWTINYYFFFRFLFSSIAYKIYRYYRSTPILKFQIRQNFGQLFFH